MSNPAECMKPAKFVIGDLVQRVNQPEMIGVVREVHFDEQTDGWTCTVQFGAQLKVVPEDVLRPFKAVSSPWDAMGSGHFSGVDHFRFILTFHRLRRPPARIAYSFATSRTQFYPHQFKPVLKFMDHPGRRILIADDVGLGKTIEAGYILRELEARQAVERVLVVVPARLASKWKKELRGRFNEHFEVVKGKDLANLAEKVRQGRDVEPFRWIVSYEAARVSKVWKAIEETQVPIDFLIADEAHRMRNPESLQHRSGIVLCRCADTAVFLSATPVQNKLDDLWHLFRLLSPEEFPEWPIFEQQMSANGSLLKAQRALAGEGAQAGEALGHLERFLEHPAGRRLEGTEMVQSVRQRLAQPVLERRERVELQGDLGRLSPIGDILCRTRKIEALPNRPQREAAWTRIQLSPVEQMVHSSVERIVREYWPGEPESWGFRMSLLAAYRITASCIPAAIEYFAHRLGTKPEEVPIADLIEEGDDAGDEGEVSPTDVGAWAAQARKELRDAVSAYDRVREVDTKLESLVDAIQKIWRNDDDERRPRRKIVVFSFSAIHFCAFISDFWNRMPRKAS